jgi:hypothetical protein
LADRAGAAEGPPAAIAEIPRRDDHAPVCERLRRFARWLEDGGRSPLYVTLLRGAAADCEQGGVVARAFAGLEMPPGSVPALRLMAALHYLVLRGEGARARAPLPERRRAGGPRGRLAGRGGDARRALR